MIEGLIFIGLGVVYLVAIFHPRLGPELYRTQWPGQYADPPRRRSAVAKCTLLSVAFMLVGIGVFLASFGTDFWKIVMLVLLAVAAVCAMAALFVG